MWRNWLDLFHDAGYSLGVPEVTAPPLDLRFPRSAGSLWLRCADSLGMVLARLWKGLFAYQFIVVARPVRGAC
jgi:hypothetical protein